MIGINAKVNDQTKVVEMQTGAAVLTSWKDIAKYVGKGVRTVQRWESALGLPVRRPTRSKKSAVFAVPAEIDSWVLSQLLMNGRSETERGDTTELLLQIRDLQAENAALRGQLEMTSRSKTA